LDFKGKRVLVTGSTRGIGRCAAEMFHQAGASVAINGRDAGKVTEVIRELGGDRLVAAPGDVSTIEGCQSAVDTAVHQLGGLDCLVNNVGTWSTAGILDVTEAEWDRVMNTNVRSALFCSKAAAPALRESTGSIVLVSSIAALTPGPSTTFLYSVAKAGLIGMMRALTVELAADNVRVNCVCPGFVDTPGVGRHINMEDDVLRDGAAQLVPLGRLGTLRECASAILYFASDDANFCAGSILSNDGGCAVRVGWTARS